MTLLVARQCRLLGAPHGAVGALRQLQRPAITATTVAVRSIMYEPPKKSGTLHKRLDLTQYRTHEKELRKQEHESTYFLTPKYEDSEVVPVASAILIPASVTAATPEHFVEKLEPINKKNLSKQNLAVFLVTPSFAPWLLNDDVFLKKALDKLYSKLVSSFPKVHVICAVVDKLPAAVPVAPEGGRSAVRAGLKSRAQNPPVNETGLEGISYVLLPTKAEVSAQPNVSGEQGCIDFLAHTHTTNQGRHHDRLRLPLANTVFQTGEPSTLINSTWEYGGSGLRIRSRRAPKTAVINLSAKDAVQQQSYKSELQTYLTQEAPALSIPLIPLTVPRQVDGYMGNIIRVVIGPDGNKITASTELEQAVPRYFKSRGEPAQATSAWALVIPKDKVHTVNTDFSQLMRSETGADMKDLKPEDREYFEQKAHEALWQRDPPRWNSAIQAAIAKGARLHKVLSGGGGWGKKAGLLSLDPVPIGAPIRQEHEKMDEGDDFDSVDEFSTALKPVVEDGDYIQFFISTAVPQAEETSPFQELKKLESSTDGGVWSWEFGVVPSTVDSIPGGSWQYTGTVPEDIAVFRGSFGALTERGLTLMRGRRMELKTGMGENLGTTMIDVPFSRWSALRLFPRPGVSTKTVGDFGKKAKENAEGGATDTSDASNSL